MNKLIASILCLSMLSIQTLTFAQDEIGLINLPESEVTITSADVVEEIEVHQKAVKTLPYNYEGTYRVPIKLRITESITTKGENLTEGQTLQFKVLQDTYCRRKTFLKKGTVINAKIETLITSGMNGFPAELIVGHFEVPGAKPSQLVDTYTKKGQNRCYVVYPIKWALTIIPFVGSLTNLIKGGHAQIKTTDEVVIYYYPDWK